MSFRSLASLRCAVPLFALLVLSACSDDRVAALSQVDVIDIPTVEPGPQQNQNISNPTLVIPDTFPIAEGDELRLVFEEEFNGPAINPEVWFFATGDGTEKGLPGGWGNNELQYYLPDNAMIVNGVLEITARRETVGDLNYTSARINTEDRFAFKYGRIEASIKMPSGQGLWPAFWMLSQDSDYVCGVDDEGNDRPCVWAAIGEIDIVEAINLDGTNGNEIFATIHYGGEFPANQSSSVTYTPSVDVTETFNTYAIEWDENEIRWYFNGELYASQPSNVWFSAADNAGPGAPFDQNFHILLNLAVGGNFPGDPNGATPFPATMEVDWVRVYSGEDPSGTAATEPSVSAPTPTEDAANVISLFSDTYDDIAGIDYNPNWGQGTVVTIAQIAGNEMLRFANLDYQGTDFAGNPQDVSDKGILHLDFWTADSTALNVYLISPGPAETAYSLTEDIAPNSWVSVDIPLSEFAGVDLTNLIQLKFDGNGTVFLDNLYFAGEAPIIVPPVGVTPPPQDEADVISLFSGAYTNETVTWPTVWSEVGAVNDVTIDGTLVKEHLGVNFVGVEFVVDASAMTHLHVDVWTPDADSLLLRLVDFLGDGFAGPAGNTDAALTFDLTATQGEWVSLDIPLSDFQDAGLTSVSDLNQLVIDPTPDGTTLYVANVYFYNADGGGGATSLGVFSETNTDPIVNITDLFSAGNTVGIDTASTAVTPFDGAVSLALTYSDNTQNNFFGGAIFEFDSADLSAYDTLKFSIDTSVFTNFANLTVQLEPPAGGTPGGNVSLATYTPVATSGTWNTYEIPLADFTAVNLSSVNRLGFFNARDGSDVLLAGTLYLDDIHFTTADGGTGGATSLGVFSETNTDPIVNITDLFSAGNTVGIDTASTAVTPFDGAVSLALTYSDNTQNNFFGGAIFEFDSADLSAYDTLKFSIDTSVFTNFANLTVQLEPPAGGTPGGNVSLATYTPVATSGTWNTYEIPLADFTAVNLSSVNRLGFFNARDGSDVLLAGTLYLDDIHFTTADGGTGGATSLGVFSETNTDPIVNITDLFSAGNTVGIDTASTAVTPFDGAVSLALTYSDNTQNNFFGGAIFEFDSADLSAYDTLKFSIDTSVFTNFANLTVQLEPPAGGTPGGNVSLATYTPVATSGTWNTYEIPLADFTAVNLSSVNRLGFFNARDGSDVLLAGTLYLDDIHFTTAGGGAAEGELAVNGDFETGSFDGWTQFVNSGVQSISGDTPTDGGSFSAALSGNTAPGAGGTTEIKQANLGSGGALSVGDVLTIRFQVKGTFGPGGQLNVLSFTEFGGGGADLSNNTIISGGVDDWTQYDYDVTLSGGDASGGFSLAFNPVCGAVTDCIADVLIDNVSITTN